MFMSMDGDGNGELSVDEILEGLKAQGVQVWGSVEGAPSLSLLIRVCPPRCM